MLHITPALEALSLVSLAEFGDKSQLVCLVLGARHRPAAVAIGAIGAFALLNTGAVLVGAGVGALVPPAWLALTVAVLFAAFGLATLRDAVLGEGGAHEDEEPAVTGGRSVAAATFLLILVAELGDKTQLTVAALAAEGDALATWVGATVALSITSATGAWMGAALLRRVPLKAVRWTAGLLFLAFAAWSGWAAYAAFTAAPL